MQAAKEIVLLWKLFLSVDAVQLEINPLVETKEGEVIAVDAKISFDDNAEFRQKSVFVLNETSEMDPREVEAAQHNLNYVGLDGNIGCLGTFQHNLFISYSLKVEAVCTFMKTDLLLTNCSPINIFNSIVIPSPIRVSCWNS